MNEVKTETTVLERVTTLLKTTRGEDDDRLDRMRLTTKKIQYQLDQQHVTETPTSITAVRAAVKVLTERKDVSMRNDHRGRPTYMWRNAKDRNDATERKAVEQRADVLGLLLGANNDETHGVSDDGTGNYVLSQQALTLLIIKAGADPGRLLRATTLPLQVCTGPIEDKPCPHGPDAVAHFMSTIGSDPTRPTCVHCMDVMRYRAEKAGQPFTETPWSSYRATGL